MRSAKQHGCREASRLLSQRQDRSLQLGEGLALRVHLWMCVGCTRYARQLDLLAKATSEWRKTSVDKD